MEARNYRQKLHKQAFSSNIKETFPIPMVEKKKKVEQETTALANLLTG